jgi:DNA invertase Pin-like site-specific DNA recombinase
MEAAAYLRVSSKAQNHATQAAAIERAAQARGDTIEATYSEKRSGKSLARPELQRLLADARAGKVRRLYVFKYDRLCRSGDRFCRLGLPLVLVGTVVANVLAAAR